MGYWADDHPAIYLGTKSLAMLKMQKENGQSKAKRI
tara:strand:+ start:2229 stop:2336 length:108 start_codon:yes stop_codon:yes gene_type:complete